VRVILVYDVSTETPQDRSRLNRVRKVVRRYLHQVQKSVFEGELTVSQLERLKLEVTRVADRKRDSVVIYSFKDAKELKREILTDAPDPTSNFL